MSWEDTELDIELPDEFSDFEQIMVTGAKKHGENNWLEPGGRKSSFKDMHASMFRHVAESYAAGPWAFGTSLREDYDSKKDPLLHAICRCMMMYTRLKRGIIHPDDEQDFKHLRGNK